MPDLSVYYGRLISYFFEAVLFLFYAAPFERRTKRGRQWAQYVLFCLVFVFAKYLWATNNLYNLLIMTAACSLYFRFCCNIAWSSMLAHSCIFASSICLTRSILYGTMKFFFDDDFFNANAWVFRVIIFLLKAVSVYFCRKQILYLDKKEKTSPTGIFLAFNPYIFLFAMNYISVGEDTLSNHKELLIIHLSLILASLLSIIVFFMNLARENHEHYISRLESAMREDYSRAQEKEANDAEIRRLTHDIHHYLSALQGEGENTGRNIRKILSKINQYERVAYSGNSVLDAVLNEKKQQAAAASVRLEYFMDQVDYSFLSGMDLCSIFGNALENAIEAAQKIENPEQRWVSVKSSVLRGIWVLHVDNSYLIEPVQDNGRFVTTKSGGGSHGIGISSIRYCAGKYGGRVEIVAEKQQFTLRVMIPVTQENPV